MKIEIIEKGNLILRKISKINKALSSFEREELDIDGKLIEVVNLKPKLIIEHLNEEYDGNTQTEVPIILNNDLINIIKSYLLEEKEKLEKEFDLL
jgi:hypothetical protein